MLSRQTTAGPSPVRRTLCVFRRRVVALKSHQPSSERQPGWIESDCYALTGDSLREDVRSFDRRIARGVDGPGTGAQFDLDSQIGPVVIQREKVRPDSNHISYGERPLSDLFIIEQRAALFREIEDPVIAVGALDGRVHVRNVRMVEHQVIAGQTAQRQSFAIDRYRIEIEIFTNDRSEEHTSELQSLRHLVCRLLLEKK